MTDHLTDIRKQGFTIIEGLLSDATRQAIRDELAPYLRGEKMGRNDFEGYHTERVYALLAKSPSCAEMIEHPEVLTLVDAFLPPNYLLSSALVIYMHPGETAQNFHRDDGAAGFAPMPRPPLGISTIWAFDDFTTENGATEIIPGSHLWDADRQPDPADAQPVTMPAGSVLVFAGNLYHRGGANRSDAVRMAITPQYCMPQLRQLENMTLAVPPDVAGRYSPRVQSLLGYSVIDPGFMGYVDGMHPRRLIDPEYQGRKVRSDLPPS